MTFEELYSWRNLLLARQKAGRGKRGRGPAAEFEHRLEDNLVLLQEEIASLAWWPGNYCSFLIHEPKRRLISAAPFRDRVVHHALCNLIEPEFDRSFIDDSYANRQGKGTHRALQRVQQFARRTPYVLQMDLRQFFPAVDHEILSGILARKIHDERLLEIVHRILASGVGVLDEEYSMVWFSSDDLLAQCRPRGLPIGNLTSQFWANCFLNGFDHFVTRQLRPSGYVRYVDDFMLFGTSKKKLWEWKRQIEDRLAELRMVPHPGAQPQRVEHGIPFLGFITFPDQRRLKRRKGIHFRRKLHQLVAAWYDHEIDLPQLKSALLGWINHTRYANTVGLRKSIIGPVRLCPANRRNIENPKK